MKWALLLMISAVACQAAQSFLPETVSFYVVLGIIAVVWTFIIASIVIHYRNKKAKGAQVVKSSNR